MKEKNSIDQLHDYSIHIDSRTIFLGSEEVESGTDNKMAERLIKNLHLLESISKEAITIIMQNPGGEEYSMFAMYDAIRASKCHITIKAFGEIMSAGSIIFQAADVRIMAPNAVQMVHYGSFAFEGHAKDVQKWAKESSRIDNWMEQVYYQRIKTKKSKVTILDTQKLLMFDSFLTAKQSVDLGLCDKIL